MCRLFLALLIVSSIFLASCSSGLLGVASVVQTVIVADNDRRSIGTIADDSILNLNLESWALNNEDLKDAHINFSIYNGIVLITGEVPHTDMQKYLVTNVPLQSENVTKVIDETIIGAPSSLATRAKDTLIDSRIALALNSQEVVNPMHVKVHTESTVVFLMGDVTEREAVKASEIVASIGSTHGVTTIIKHFNYLKEISLREQQRAKKREEAAMKERERLEQQQELDAKKKRLQKELKALEKQSQSL